jgi:molybdopterin converting factor small subunit
VSTREIRVLLFAAARDAVGAAEVDVWAAPEATTEEIRALLMEEYPDAAGILAGCRIAIGRVFAEPGDRIPEKAEVALIPPVSGG